MANGVTISANGLSDIGGNAVSLNPVKHFIRFATRWQLSGSERRSTNQFQQPCLATAQEGITYTRYGKGYEVEKLAEIIEIIEYEKELIIQPWNVL
jgi:hypothetical protein